MVAGINLYISSRQLLIASPDRDILTLFNEYFRSRGQVSITVDNENGCLEEVRYRLTSIRCDYFGH